MRNRPPNSIQKSSATPMPLLHENMKHSDQPEPVIYYGDAVWHTGRDGISDFRLSNNFLERDLDHRFFGFQPYVPARSGHVAGT